LTSIFSAFPKLIVDFDSWIESTHGLLGEMKIPGKSVDCILINIYRNLEHSLNVEYFDGNYNGVMLKCSPNSSVMVRDRHRNVLVGQVGSLGY